MEVEPQCTQQDLKANVNQYSTTQRTVLRVHNIMIIRRIKTNWFNKGPLENNTSNPSDPRNSRNHNENPKKTIQPQCKTKNSKKPQLEIEKK